jgi:arsenite methyltransferase
MKYLKAKMFNRKAADLRNKPDQILEILQLKEGQNVVDIGAGGGYFSLRFATAVGSKGKVYAVDTNPEFLEFISNTATAKGLSNIVAVLAKEDSLGLPEGSIDLVFMRNVYHHLQNRVEYFRRLSHLLMSNGKVAIIEYKCGGCFSFRRLFGHHVPVEIIICELTDAGLKLDMRYDFLPEQSFTIFSLKR